MAVRVAWSVVKWDGWDFLAHYDFPLGDAVKVDMIKDQGWTIGEASWTFGMGPTVYLSRGFLLAGRPGD